MSNLWKGIALAAIGFVASFYSSVARADDAAVIEERQGFMKAQSKDLGAIKAFMEDKGDLAAAQTAGADLVTRIPKIPDFFPKGTDLDAYSGKSFAKPAIWTEHDKFLAADKNALTAAEALNAALKGGDKAAITTAFGNMTRDFWGTTSPNPGGCGGCHGTFTQKRPS
ncbi:MAG TPA: cytochrome c [Stellaceae bacterium]|nr:cytochrome c [Stellaceae bacterium]